MYTNITILFDRNISIPIYILTIFKEKYERLCLNFFPCRKEDTKQHGPKSTKHKTTIIILMLCYANVPRQ